MTPLKPLLAKNRSWALQRRERNPDYFEQYLHQQKRHSLWIGCSDSRVPAEVLTGSHPGELFVHRNIANMVLPDDDNFLSVLQYAIFYLGVERIVLCGHYGCGGVQAALGLPASPLAQEEESSKLNRLVEANVITQFSQLVRCEPEQQAWQAGQQLDVFGCVYDLQSGHLKELI
ncbi:carbonate dehydratase [Plautia stali symbiont]|nr:carbonate dehydratase [Plautia stali symbiont]